MNENILVIMLLYINHRYTCHMYFSHIYNQEERGQGGRGKGDALREKCGMGEGGKGIRERRTLGV